MNTKLFFTSVTFALPLIATTAAAWEWMGTPSVPTRWPNSIKVNGLDYARYYAIADSNSFPLGTDAEASLKNALSNLNKLPSKIRYTATFVTFNSTNGYGKLDNHKNEMWFATPTTANKLAGGILAYTHTKTFTPPPPAIGHRLSEADVVFNKKLLPKFEFTQNKNALPIWNPSLTSLTNKYSFMAVAMHELGHAAGANHEGDIPNLMGYVHGGILPGGKTTSGYHLPGTKDKNGNELAIPVAGSDFTNGMTNAYGIDPNKKEDVSISPWKFHERIPDCDPTKCDVWGYYSVHTRKDLLYDTLGNQIAPVANAADPNYMRNDPVYKIAKNTTYQAAFLYDNTGKSPALTVRWRAYVSTDAVLNTALDRSIESGGFGNGEFTIDRTLGADGGPMRQLLLFKLPTDLASNQPYYLFIMLDPPPTDPNQIKIDEANELDNFTYVKIVPL